MNEIRNEAFVCFQELVSTEEKQWMKGEYGPNLLDAYGTETQYTKAVRTALSAPTYEDAVKIVEEQRQEFMRDVYPEHASLVSVYDALLSTLKEGKKE